MQEPSPTTAELETKDTASNKEHRYQALSAITTLAKAFVAQESWIAPVSLFSIVCVLHGEIFASSAKPKLQEDLSELCELWFTQNRSSRDAVAPQMISYLLARALATDSKQLDLKRLFMVREALTYLDLEDESTLQLRILVQRTFLHTQFLALGGDNFGRRFLIWALTALPLVALFHKTMKSGLVSAPKWKRESYANVYFRAWQTAEGPFKLRIEAALTNLVDSALHVQNSGARRAAESVLQYFVDQKSIEKKVEDLLHRLYSPLLFHALEVANPNVRENALRQLGIVFPLVPPVLPQGEFDEALQEQFHTLVDSLEDRAPNVRSQAVLSIGRIVSTFWDLLPLQSVRAILNHITDELVFDRASPAVRESVFRVLAAIIEQTPASHRLFAEKGYLNRLGPLIFDTSEKVRIACASLLETVRKVRVIKFYDIVEFDKLLDALGTESSEKVVRSITRVLQASYWPHPRYPVEDIVVRAVTLINMNPKAAIAFYKHAKLIDSTVAVNFMIQLWNEHLVPMVQDLEESEGSATKKVSSAPAKKSGGKKTVAKKSSAASKRAKAAPPKKKIIKKKIIVTKVVKVLRPKAQAHDAEKLKSGKKVRWADENADEPEEAPEQEFEEVEETVEEEIEVEVEEEVDDVEAEEEVEADESEPSAKRPKTAEEPLESNKENIVAITRIVATLWERVEGTVSDQATLKSLYDALSQESVLATLQHCCPDSSLSKITSRLPAKTLKKFATDSIAQVTNTALALEDGNPSPSQKALLPCIFAWDGDYAVRLVDSIAKLLNSGEHRSQVLGSRLVGNILTNEFAWVRDAFIAQPKLLDRIDKALKAKVDEARLILDGEEASSQPGMIIECIVLRLKMLLHSSYASRETGSNAANDAFEETAAWLESGIIPVLKLKSREKEMERKVDERAPSDLQFPLHLASTLLLALNDYDALKSAIVAGKSTSAQTDERPSPESTSATSFSRSVWKITKGLLQARSDKQNLCLVAAIGWKLLAREAQSSSRSVLPSADDRASFTILLMSRDQTPGKRLSIAALRTLCKQRNEYVKIALDRLWSKIGEFHREDDYGYEIDTETIMEGELEPIIAAFGGAVALLSPTALWTRAQIEREHRAPIAVWSAIQLCYLLLHPSSKRPVPINAAALRPILTALFASMREDVPAESILRSRLDQLLKNPAFAKR